MSDITVDIYRDVDIPRSEIESVYKGIEPIREHVPGLSIDLAVRAIRFTNLRDGQIDTMNFRWPRFKAYINVVLTSKPLLDDRADEAYRNPLGIHNFRPLGPAGWRNGQVIIVNSDPSTTTHELGHAFGLKNGGEHWNGEGHCTLKGCYMYPYAQYKYEYPATRWQKLRSAVGVPVVPRIEARNCDPQSFCPECATHLGRHAHYLTRIFAGEPVPADLLWGDQ